jgi:phage terminase large subunit-like protein
MKIQALRALDEGEQALRLSLFERIALMPLERRRAFLRSLPPRLKGEFLLSWYAMGRPGQWPPAGEWRIWLMMAGRGYGKTIAGAHWVHLLAEQAGLRIALVGPTEDEVRNVMVEGVAGLLACAPPWARPEWEPSLGRLTWPNGTRASVHSGANPEALRGPEYDYAWCDELAKWAQAEAAWDNLMLGLRRGPLPQALATTTPRPTPLMRRLAARPEVRRTGGRTADNPLLAESYFGDVTDLYAGTRLGRQELDGELIEDVEGSLWPWALIEKCRVPPLPWPREGPGVGSVATGSHSSETHPPPTPPCAQGAGIFRRVVIGVDPPASAKGDACGIVACGLGHDGLFYVLGDHSVRGLGPEGWAARVVAAAEAWGAERVVVEANQGGEMVASVLAGVDPALPVKPVQARFGKGARAEPVALRFERGEAKLAGAFPELEDELAGMTTSGPYQGPGRSPDRADAMVWAMAELIEGRTRPMPRVRRL